jgi:hypothetical protein
MVGSVVNLTANLHIHVLLLGTTVENQTPLPAVGFILNDRAPFLTVDVLMEAVPVNVK